MIEAKLYELFPSYIQDNLQIREIIIRHQYFKEKVEYHEYITAYLLNEMCVKIDEFERNDILNFHFIIKGDDKYKSKIIITNVETIKDNKNISYMNIQSIVENAIQQLIDSENGINYISSPRFLEWELSKIFSFEISIDSDMVESLSANYTYSGDEYTSLLNRSKN